MSLSQLQKQVSYLTFEIQNGGVGGGIQTINDLMPDASHNFFLTAGSNITIDASQNGVIITNTAPSIYQNINSPSLFSQNILLTEASYGIYDASNNLFYISNFGNPTSNIITLNENGDPSSFFTPNETILGRGFNCGCILQQGDFIYASSYNRYIYKIDLFGNATDFSVLPVNRSSLGMCYVDGYLYICISYPSI